MFDIKRCNHIINLNLDPYKSKKNDKKSIKTKTNGRNAQGLDQRTIYDIGNGFQGNDFRERLRTSLWSK